MIQPLFIFSDWGLFILRIVFGLIFLTNALPQIKSIKEVVKKRGFWSAISAVLEFLGAAALIIGFLTQVISFILVVVLLIMFARWKIYKSSSPEGLFAITAFVWLLIAVGLALATLGGGYCSLDSYLSFLLY